jgi:O-antigen/teichoic acid export membrane protein
MVTALNYKFLAQSLGFDEARDFLENRYFLLGLAIQKGTPILILPLTIAAIGVKAYADYVLVFSVVQVLGVLGSLGVAQALIPFWFNYPEKGQFVSSLSLLTLCLQALMSIPFAVALAIVIASRMKFTLVFVPLILIFAIIYNLNAMGLNLVRAQLKQVAFFWSTLFTSAVLTASILIMARAPGTKLVVYIVLNVLVLGLQTWFYFYFSRLSLRTLFPRERFLLFSREILRFSLPLTAYTMIALAALVADKWIVKGFFTAPVFAQYVLDFQFAFGVTLVSVVIGMYNAQKQCELVQKQAVVALRSNLLGNYGLSLLGSVGAALAAFAYAHVGRIHLSNGYWILVLSFALNNCYGVNSNLLAAQKRSGTIAVIGAISTCAFLVTLFLCGLWNAIGPIYIAWSGYEFLLLLLSTISIMAVLRIKAAPEGAIVNASPFSGQ